MSISREQQQQTKKEQQQQQEKLRAAKENVTDISHFCIYFVGKETCSTSIFFDAKRNMNYSVLSLLLFLSLSLILIHSSRYRTQVRSIMPCVSTCLDAFWRYFYFLFFIYSSLFNFKLCKSIEKINIHF